MSYRRSPARWLAPLAILAALAAIFAIVSATTRLEEASEDRPRAERREAPAGGSRERSEGPRRDGATQPAATTPTTGAPTRRTYRVRAGDTLASIAEQTGVTVEELQELNPGVDSNSLSIGQELRLAR